MNLRELGLEIIKERAEENAKNEKEFNKLNVMWSSMYKGLTQGNEDRELMFYMLADQHLNKGIGSVFAKLKKEIVKNRQLDTQYIVLEIKDADSNNNIDRLAQIVGEVFLEDINVSYVEFLKTRMERQGWTWETILEEFNRKEQLCRAFGCLNRPYKNKESLKLLVAI